MIRRYLVILQIAACAGLAALGAVVLASFGYASSLEVGGLSLWPFVIGAGVASVFVASWAYARSKGRSGWIGLLAPFLDIFGVKLLQRLESRADTGRSQRTA
jgi:hypothetical protein